MYDPTIGKWLSEDPMGLTVDANPYRYVGNSPTNFTDPSGLAEKGEKEEGGFWGWWHHFWGYAVDGGIEVAVEVTEKGVALPVGTACDTMEAGKGLTGIACVKKEEKRYRDLQVNPKAREKDIRKAKEDWENAKKKYLELQLEE